MTQTTNPPLRTVRLYGKMGAMFGRVHRFALDTNTPAEAVSALRSQVKGIDAYLTGAKDNGVGFAVFIGKQNIGEDELQHPAGNDDIRIAPIILGSKNGGVFQIILGIVLVAADVLVFHTGYIATVGWGMIVGGVVQLLTPMPKGLSAKDRPENTPSYSFNGPLNTQAQGNPVPLLYGRMKVGSAVISAGIDTEDTTYYRTWPSGGSGSIGGGGGGYGSAFKFGSDGSDISGTTDPGIHDPLDVGV